MTVLQRWELGRATLPAQPGDQNPALVPALVYVYYNAICNYHVIL